ncbi:MAG: pyridoxine 5'-phosphate synthase [Spirochaetia bacterium]|nr:pyridoxine 5'-phosphate synthase [Spirochaetia bacterium]
MAKLCVNIDHVATVRQARLDVVPDPLEAALIVEKTGAAGVTIHLREDRRHINDNDVTRIKKALKKKLNLEMSLAPDIVKRALAVRPDEATIVPEKRQELTTEGGLDAAGNFKRLETVITSMKKRGITVSLFIEPDTKQILASKKAGADFIEIHTGAYARKTGRARAREFDRIKKATVYALSLGLGVNAGHGLTYDNVAPVAHIPGMVDLNIGHNIIARALFIGLKNAVEEMITSMER